MLVAPVPRGDTPRRFRRAFLLAFAGRIGERLREAEAAGRREFETDTGRSTALVVADRSAAVEAAYKKAFPRVRSTTLSMSSAGGYRSGRDAANRAGLGLKLLPGGRRALGKG